jgi:hypothetical protein
MLPQILNSAFPIKLGETELMAKKATLKDFAALQQYEATLDKNDPSFSIKTMIFVIKTCVQKAYDDEEKKQITDDYIMELMPLSVIRENSTQKIFEELGFMLPKTDEKTATPLGNS